MFPGGAAPGCLLDPGLSRVTVGYSLPRAGSPVRKAPGKATLTRAVVWNKQTNEYHDYQIKIYIIRIFRSINTYWGVICVVSAHKNVATLVLTGSEQNDHFVDLKPIMDSASESAEQISLFVHVSLAMIFIAYG